MRNCLVTDVNILSKGDKVLPTGGSLSPSPRYIKDKNDNVKLNYFIFIGIVNNTAVFRDSKGRVCSYSISNLENNGWFEKVYTWTDWRPVPGDGGAFFKTNRKTIYYKKDDIKVKAECNIKHGDKFDLSYGIKICKERWDAKAATSFPIQTKNLKDGEINFQFIPDGDVLDARFYSYVVICINTDYGLYSGLGKKISDIYSLDTVFKPLREGEDPYPNCEVLTSECYDLFKNVAVIYDHLICLLTSAPHKKPMESRLYDCLYETARWIYEHGLVNISMPKICCGRNGMVWVDVQRIIEKAFRNALDDLIEEEPDFPDYNVTINVYG